MSVVPQTHVTTGKWQVFWLILAGSVFPDICKTQVFCYPVTLLVGLKKGFTASGNVADSHCVPILAPYPHGIIHKGENQMRLQSYMFFWKRQNRKRKTAVNLLFSLIPQPYYKYDFLSTWATKSSCLWQAAKPSINLSNFELNDIPYIGLKS